MEKNKMEEGKNKNYINCLTNQRIIVRHLPKERGMITNPKHILYGGMADNAFRTFVVPKTASGIFVDILTEDERVFLENKLGLEFNALSPFKKIDNFWEDSNPNGISKVRLQKQDNFLDLSNPEDYIKYKILLANTDYIAHSLKELEDRPKSTYQFVIIKENDETNLAKLNMTSTMQCYKEYGKIEDNFDMLKMIIEIIDGRPISKNTKIEFLQTKINELIQADSKLFLKIITDPLLKAKVLIRKGVDAGIIAKRGSYYYLKDGNLPLCEDGEDPVLNNAAKFLSMPARQELKFSIEAKIQ